ncbi:MAG: hypothetical protein WDA68_06440 [Phycisphaerae bacterium]
MAFFDEQSIPSPSAFKNAALGREKIFEGRLKRKTKNPLSPSSLGSGHPTDPASKKTRVSAMNIKDSARSFKQDSKSAQYFLKLREGQP